MTSKHAKLELEKGRDVVLTIRDWHGQGRQTCRFKANCFVSWLFDAEIDMIKDMRYLDDYTFGIA